MKKKNSLDQTIYKYMQFVEKTFTLVYYLILRLFTDQTLIKFVY